MRQELELVSVDLDGKSIVNSKGEPMLCYRVVYYPCTQP
jgi:hypothetical protein